MEVIEQLTLDKGKRYGVGIENKGLKVTTDTHEGFTKPGRGVTVHGASIGQAMSLTPAFTTLRCHSFYFKLLLGDPSRNVIYDGCMDDFGLPIRTNRCNGGCHGLCDDP